jgi:hypothetical protein
MRALELNLDTSRGRSVTALAGGLAATGTVVLLSGAALAPAHPGTWPSDPEVTAQRGHAVTQNCFIGQVHWLVGMGRQPQCTVAERVAGFPALDAIATSPQSMSAAGRAAPPSASHRPGPTTCATTSFVTRDFRGVRILHLTSPICHVPATGTTTWWSSPTLAPSSA